MGLDKGYLFSLDFTMQIPGKEGIVGAEQQANLHGLHSSVGNLHQADLAIPDFR